MTTPVAYLSSPLSLQPCHVLAVAEASVAADRLIAAGIAVHAPIVQSAQLRMDSPDARTRTHAAWLAVDLPMVRRCDVLVALLIPGHEHSRGMHAEIMEAQAAGIPVVDWRPAEPVHDVVRRIHEADERRAA